MAQNNIEEPTKSLDSTFESIIIDIPHNLTFSSASSSSYDTDSSVNSATCCTKHSEHMYMQKPSPHQLQHPHPHHHQHQQQHHHHHMQTSDLKSSANIDMEAVYFKADHRKSWPIFILMISLLETAVFVYNTSAVQKFAPKFQDLAIYDDSVFIYRPDRRLEVWRFISYMFLHVNWFHLGFNVVIQLFYGIPLEVMHGSLRVAIIYFAGVFAGSLGTSVVESDVYLLGASGGVYAILAANLANITLNYGQMKFASAQLFSVGIFVFCDLGQALYIQYIAVEVTTYKALPVSYVAHLTGALAGLTIGLLVLKNFEHRSYENLIWWLALGIYCAFTVFAIVFNLINTVAAQRMEEEGKVITQHLLHDLGVS